MSKILEIREKNDGELGPSEAAHLLQASFDQPADCG
jgi:hypothetical protein